jgi:hypothetical protein
MQFIFMNRHKGLVLAEDERRLTRHWYNRKVHTLVY